MASNAAPKRSETPDPHASRDASESYRRKAADCKARAASASDAATRRNYLELADYWNDMARDAESVSRLHPPSVD